MPIPDPTPSEMIRSLQSDDIRWQNWLHRFPDAPPNKIWNFDRWFDRFDPYLAEMRNLGPLEPDTLKELRYHLESFAGDLLDVQRRDDQRGKIEGGLLAGSGFAWKMNWTVLEPFSLAASALLFGRNQWEDHRWGRRKQALKRLKSHIRKRTREM